MSLTSDRSAQAYCEMIPFSGDIRAHHIQSSSPGVVVAKTNSVGASLVVWFIACLFGWTGASSYAELGTAIPLNGGPQVSILIIVYYLRLIGVQAYLAYAYGPLVSYLFAWTAISALKPGLFMICLRGS